MEFGLNLFPAVGPDEEPVHWFSDKCLRLAVLAETLGFQHVKAVEHHFSRYGGYSPDPVLTAARLARIVPVSREMLLNYVAQHSLGLPRSY